MKRILHIFSLHSLSLLPCYLLAVVFARALPIFLTCHVNLWSGPTQGVITHPGSQQWLIFSQWKQVGARTSPRWPRWLPSLTPVTQKTSGRRSSPLRAFTDSSRTSGWGRSLPFFLFFFNNDICKLLEGAEKRTSKCLQEKGILGNVVMKARSTQFLFLEQMDI